MSDIGLLNYIKNQYEAGKSLEEITLILNHTGYQQKQIDEVFIELGYIKPINQEIIPTLPPNETTNNNKQANEKNSNYQKHKISFATIILIIVWSSITFIRSYISNLHKIENENKAEKSGLFANCQLGSNTYKLWDSICQNNKLQYCNSEGKWEKIECPNGCHDGSNTCKDHCKFLYGVAPIGFTHCKNDQAYTCISEGNWSTKNCEFGCTVGSKGCNSASDSSKNICSLDSVSYDVNDRICYKDTIKVCNEDGTFDTQVCPFGCEVGQRYCNDGLPKRCQLGNEKVEIGKECFNLKEIKTCKLDGTWEIESCPYGCKEDFVQCTPSPDSLYKCQYYPSGSKNFYVQIGKKGCVANTKRTCLSDGTWKTEDCEFGCNKETSECVVKCKWKNLSYQIGAKYCHDGKSLEKCNNDGSWLKTTTCDYGCELGLTYCNYR